LAKQQDQAQFQPVDFRNTKLANPDEPTGTMQAKPNGGYSLNYQTGITDGYVVRRLTPVECERLQGFPDHYTDVPYKGKEHPSDTPRYKALGNSFAVPVVRWLGERIELVEEIFQQI
jgi:DNA (cytosine-5)-methyltransferase 1